MQQFWFCRENILWLPLVMKFTSLILPNETFYLKLAGLQRWARLLSKVETTRSLRSSSPQGALLLRFTVARLALGKNLLAESLKKAYGTIWRGWWLIQRSTIWSVNLYSNINGYFFKFKESDSERSLRIKQIIFSFLPQSLISYKEDGFGN